MKIKLWNYKKLILDLFIKTYFLNNVIPHDLDNYPLLVHMMHIDHTHWQFNMM